MRRWTIPLLLVAGCTLEQAPLGVADAGADGPPAGDGGVEGPADAGVRDAGRAMDGGEREDAGEPEPDAGPGPLCAASDEDLVVCYGFEGDLTDGSAQANHLRDDAASARFVDGAVGLGIDHQVGDQLWIPHHPSLDLDRFTIELWVRVDALPSSGRVGLVDRGGEYGVFIYAPGEVRCAVQSGASWLADPAPVAAGEWMHFACAYDGTQVLLYRNGVLAAAATLARSTPQNPSDVRLGANAPTGEELDGQLDEVRIWRRALAPSELGARRR